MSESVHAGASSAAREIPTSGVKRDSNGATAGWAVELIRGLAILNLVLVALQASSAGFFLSGDGRGVNAHAGGAKALLCGALVQAVSGVVLWRRGRVPGWVAGNGLVLLVVVFLEAGLGYSKQYWLHLPLGVLMFGGLVRQVGRMGSLRRWTGGRS
jgi:hypothetical protein